MKMRVHLTRCMAVSCIAICFMVCSTVSQATPPVVASQTTPALAAPSAAPPTLGVVGVTGLEMSYSDGSAIVRVKSSGPLNFAHKLVPPTDGKGYRLILDCFDADYKLGGKSFANMPETIIRTIRGSQHAVTPSHSCRIVFDLAREAMYSVAQTANVTTISITDRTCKRFANWNAASASPTSSAVSPAISPAASAPGATSAELNPHGAKPSAVVVKTDKPIVQAPAKAPESKAVSQPVVTSAAAPAKLAPQSVAKPQVAKVEPTAIPTTAQKTVATAKPTVQVSAKAPESKPENKAVAQPVVVSAAAPAKLAPQGVEKAQVTKVEPTAPPTTTQKTVATAKPSVVTGTPVETKIASDVKSVDAVKPMFKSTAPNTPVIATAKPPVVAGNTVATKNASDVKSADAVKPVSNSTALSVPVVATAPDGKVAPTAPIVKSTEVAKTSVSQSVKPNAQAVVGMAPAKASAQSTSPAVSVMAVTPAPTEVASTKASAPASPSVPVVSAPKVAPVTAVNSNSVPAKSNLAQTTETEQELSQVPAQKLAPKTDIKAANAHALVSEKAVSTIAEKPVVAQPGQTVASALKTMQSSPMQATPPPTNGTIATSVPAKSSEKLATSVAQSSLFGTVVAAADKQGALGKNAPDTVNTAKFRRSADNSARVKGTMIAEFPQRLSIKYGSHLTRDPFESLWKERRQKPGATQNKTPNVESLTMVGVLEDVNGERWGLFEDINGIGYILGTGDKVENGSVLRIESDKAYFNIFEYGWSRTVDLRLHDEL